MFLLSLLKQMLFFTGSYSNNVFPEPLTEEEEEKYIFLLEQGDEVARNMLIEHNLRLVAHIVKRFENHSEDTDDLIGIGTIGLIKGVDSYDQSKKIKLTTYVAKCIQNEILMYFRKVKGENIKNISLNDSIGLDKDGNEISLMDVIKDNSEDFASILQTKDHISLINDYIKILSKREQEVIAKRYGLMNQKEMTQKELAKKMHISRSYVSRIEKRALTKILREFMKHHQTLEP